MVVLDPVAETLDITLEKGATFRVTITWYDAASALVNLTGYSARMKVRAADGRLLLTLLSGVASPLSGLTLGGAAGTIAILISATDTAALAGLAASYDLEAEASNGDVRRLIQGAITLSPEATT